MYLFLIQVPYFICTLPFSPNKHLKQLPSHPHNNLLRLVMLKVWLSQEYPASFHGKVGIQTWVSQNLVLLSNHYTPLGLFRQTTMMYHQFSHLQNKHSVPHWGLLWGLLRSWVEIKEPSRRKTTAGTATPQVLCQEFIQGYSRQALQQSMCTRTILHWNSRGVLVWTGAAKTNGSLKAP